MAPPAAPQILKNTCVNSSNLVELQVLAKVATNFQSDNDIRGSIPYLAKIVQIIDNQKIERVGATEDPVKKEQYFAQLNELRKTQADAHAQLAEAYFHTQQFVQCEASYLISVKIWENLVQHMPNDSSDSCVYKKCLKKGFTTLKDSYEAMGKTQLAQHMETRLNKLET